MRSGCSSLQCNGCLISLQAGRIHAQVLKSCEYTAIHTYSKITTFSFFLQNLLSPPLKVSPYRRLMQRLQASMLQSGLHGPLLPAFSTPFVSPSSVTGLITSCRQPGALIMKMMLWLIIQSRLLLPNASQQATKLLDSPDCLTLLTC